MSSRAFSNAMKVVILPMHCLRGAPPSLAGATALVCAACCAIGSPRSSDTVRRALDAAYSRENAATLRKDVRGMLADETDGFVSVAVDGTRVNHRQERFSLPDVLKTLTPYRMTTTIRRVTLRGSAATVLIAEHLEAMYGSAGKAAPGRLIIDGTLEDVWIRAAGAWRKKRSTALSMSRLLDGQPI